MLEFAEKLVRILCSSKTHHYFRFQTVIKPFFRSKIWQVPSNTLPFDRPKIWRHHGILGITYTECTELYVAHWSRFGYLTRWHADWMWRCLDECLLAMSLTICHCQQERLIRMDTNISRMQPKIQPVFMHFYARCKYQYTIGDANRRDQIHTTGTCFCTIHTDFCDWYRGIYKAENGRKSAKLYVKNELWNAVT